MALPKLKDINWVTTDCYGSLIDWEKGISDAFKPFPERRGLYRPNTARAATTTAAMPKIAAMAGR